jgi:hypothetical protein
MSTGIFLHPAARKSSNIPVKEQLWLTVPIASL